METKKLFLLAAMLLMSVCSFAQNDNTPLKGDVNEDGKVDVADIAAVINIMKNGGGTTDGKLYFYVGTEKPTSLSQATIVNSYPAEQTYTNNSGKKSHIFVLTNSDKTVEFINLAINNPVDQFDVDITTIPGYKIFETAVGLANTSSIIIRITEAPVYYWYAGTTVPTADNLASIKSGSMTAKPTTWTSDNPQSISATNNTGSSSYIYYCFPANWNVIVLDEDKVTEMALADVSTFTLNGIGYTVKRTGRLISNGTTKPYYAKC